MRVGDAFLGSRTWERGMMLKNYSKRCLLFFFFKTFPPYFSSAFYLFMHYVGLCWVFIAACRLLLAAASGSPLWVLRTGSSAVASLVAEHGRCGRSVSVAAAPRI